MRRCRLHGNRQVRETRQRESGGELKSGADRAGTHCEEALAVTMETRPMRLTNNQTEEILVDRDPEGSTIEVRIEGATGEDSRLIHLTRDEARRLASLI